MTKKNDVDAAPAPENAATDSKLPLKFVAEIVGVEMHPNSTESAYVVLEAESGGQIKIEVDLDTARAYGARLFARVAVSMEIQE